MLSERARISTIVGLFANLILSFSAVFGNDFWRFGFELTLYLVNRIITKANTALSLITEDTTTTFSIDKKASLFTASYYQRLHYKTMCSAEGKYILSDKSNSFSIGKRHLFGDDDLIQASLSVSNGGSMRVLFQHHWTLKSFFTIAGERLLNHSSQRFGLAVEL
ncbi:unnamed protein product [Arabidopsis thaliana]|uniref:Uncharacterized protein n=1 Tax=Arabidopsis thaliana TaxID=3702 RepID=A0A5S9Y902_ARATH|nr:unnamed protein product [Arabidopsis thaliana]